MISSILSSVNKIALFLYIFHHIPMISLTKNIVPQWTKIKSYKDICLSRFLNLLRSAESFKRIYGYFRWRKMDLNYKNKKKKSFSFCVIFETLLVWWRWIGEYKWRCIGLFFLCKRRFCDTWIVFKWTRNGILVLNWRALSFNGSIEKTWRP